MITAIDTNILLDILALSEEWHSSSAEALERSAVEDSLVVCDLVYAELCVHFARQGECDEFLHANEIRVESLSRGAHFMASRAWRSYRQAGGEADQDSGRLPDRRARGDAGVQTTLARSGLLSAGILQA